MTDPDSQDKEEISDEFMELNVGEDWDLVFVYQGEEVGRIALDPPHSQSPEQDSDQRGGQA